MTWHLNLLYSSAPAGGKTMAMILSPGWLVVNQVIPAPSTYITYTSTEHQQVMKPCLNELHKEYCLKIKLIALY